MIGRHVSSFDDIERPGDYFGPTDEVEGEDHHPNGKRGVWFLLPIHEGSDKFDRPTEGSGLHRVTEPPWTFRECQDGSLEIRASIGCGPQPYYWHGYLDEGHVWRRVL